MAALGTVPVLDLAPPTALQTPSAYTVERGNYLGVISAIMSHADTVETRAPSNYIVRQLTVIFRQLWPAYGQRFPQ